MALWYDIIWYVKIICTFPGKGIFVLVNIIEIKANDTEKINTNPDKSVSYP